MALDEAILDAVAAGDAPPTLRLYWWRGRWLSIGMGEPIADVDHAAVRQAGVGVLRRPSGGTAVLHVGQIGWALALPTGHELASGDIVESYRQQAEISLAACRALGITARACTLAEARAPLPDPNLRIACFAALAPHEIVVGNPPRKLVGWAQVRRRGVVMHHAAASLRFDPNGLAALLAADRPRLAAALAGRVVGLSEAAGRPIAAAEVADVVARAYATAGLDLRSAALSQAELRRARQLVREKYAAKSWTGRR